MFLPVGSNLPFFRFPVVTASWILLSAALFLVVSHFDQKWELPAKPAASTEASAGKLSEPKVTYAEAEAAMKRTLTYQLAYIPAEQNPLWKFFTYQFTHASWGHLISNMWYITIFGWILENALGSLTFLFLTLFFGAISVFPELIFQSNPHLPIVGASGAVAFTMGTAVALFPRTKVKLLFMFFPMPNFPNTFFMPLRYVIYFWLTLQISGLAMNLWLPPKPVAYATHLFGFALGLGVGALIRRYRKAEKMLDVELSGKDLKAFYESLELYQNSRIEEANAGLEKLSTKRPWLISLQLQLFGLAIAQRQQELAEVVWKNVLPHLLVLRKSREIENMVQEFVRSFEISPPMLQHERVKLLKLMKPILEKNEALAERLSVEPAAVAI